MRDAGLPATFSSRAERRSGLEVRGEFQASVALIDAIEKMDGLLRSLAIDRHTTLR